MLYLNLDNFETTLTAQFDTAGDTSFFIPPADAQILSDTLNNGIAGLHSVLLSVGDTLLVETGLVNPTTGEISLDPDGMIWGWPTNPILPIDTKVEIRSSARAMDQKYARMADAPASAAAHDVVPGCVRNLSITGDTTINCAMVLGGDQCTPAELICGNDAATVPVLTWVGGTGYVILWQDGVAPAFSVGVADILHVFLTPSAISAGGLNSAILGHWRGYPLP